mmetsp:Transcript_106265/g.195090  ORF Transcript_106265/g.195090 Transcript_106265/m.195090 type:complete len:171 (-) Transcript_106265:48-560(-)
MWQCTPPLSPGSARIIVPVMGPRTQRATPKRTVSGSKRRKIRRPLRYGLAQKAKPRAKFISIKPDVSVPTSMSKEVPLQKASPASCETDALARIVPPSTRSRREKPRAPIKSSSCSAKSWRRNKRLRSRLGRHRMDTSTHRQPQPVSRRVPSAMSTFRLGERDTILGHAY